MKIVVIGGVAGGASAAARIRRLNEQAEIVMLERGEHVSFSNCSLPYYLGDEVPSEGRLLMMTPMAFEKRFNIDARVRHEAIRIDRKEKRVLVRDLNAGTEYEEAYDRLILAPGAVPIQPESIPGIHGENVFTLRNVTDARRIKDRLAQEGVQDVAVIGGGFIGIEVAENLVRLGKRVCIVEGANQILSQFDFDMVQTLHKELLDHGVELRLNTLLRSVGERSITVEKNGVLEEFSTDMVLLAIGVAPETRLATEAGLTLGSTRGILVDGTMRTNDPDIYAVGDAVESFNRITVEKGRLPLAGPAQWQARVAADAICGLESENAGYLGSSCLRVFDQNAACTGLNERTLQQAGIPYQFAYVLPGDKVAALPGAAYMGFKLLFETPTGRVLGAQAIGKGDVTKRVDVIATVIALGGTLEDVKRLELCYSPVFGTAKDVVNIAALVGLNLLSGRVKQVPVSVVRQLVEQGAYIVDVREEGEFAEGHLKGAHNIPLTQFRVRMAEIPRDVPVYLHCRTSQRSYYAICELLGNDYDNVINISGSFLGISLYEYFRDKTERREPIVTDYCFR